MERPDVETCQAKKQPQSKFTDILLADFCSCKICISAIHGGHKQAPTESLSRQVPAEITYE
jgi:hypothetical protein